MSKFETEICPRCCGTGTHSFNLTHGRVCFKCGGKKEILTKRGSAANAFFHESLKTPVSSMVPGEFMFDVYSRKWRQILAIRIDGNRAQIDAKGMNFETSASSEYEVVKSEEYRKEKLAEAIVYQGTLTKSGVPNKR